MIFKVTNRSTAALTIGVGYVEVADGIGDREQPRFSGGSPSSEGGSSDHKRNQSSLYSTMTGPSNRSNRPASAGRDL